MNKALTFLAGAGSGAALMFMLDPDRGRRRRAFVRDKAAGAWNDAQDKVRKTSRDIGNRTYGMVASTRSALRRQADRENVVERIRSRIGRVVSHPHAIQIAQTDGRVVVSGHILASEVSDLLKTVRAVKGVENVENRLEVHETAENVQALQGGTHPHEHRSGTGSPGWKTVASVTGSALAAYTLARRRDVLGKTLMKVVRMAA